MALKFDSNVNRRLKEFARQNKNAANKILLKAGEFMAKELEKNTPVSKTGKTRHKYHLKESVVYDNDTELKDTVRIGFNGHEAWRVHFVELGTIFHAPQPFIERTQREKQKEVQKLIENELNKVIQNANR